MCSAYILLLLPPCAQLGDWGRDGDFNQSRVAAMMALKAEQLQPDFVIRYVILAQACGSSSLRVHGTAVTD